MTNCGRKKSGVFTSANGRDTCVLPLRRKMALTSTRIRRTRSVVALVDCGVTERRCRVTGGEWGCWSDGGNPALVLSAATAMLMRPPRLSSLHFLSRLRRRVGSIRGDCVYSPNASREVADRDRLEKLSRVLDLRRKNWSRLRVILCVGFLTLECRRCIVWRLGRSKSRRNCSGILSSPHYINYNILYIL